jgi:hypothetical protein
LQNSRVAALSKRPRADSSSAGTKAAALFFFASDLPMRISKSERGKFIKPDVPVAQKNRRARSICIAHGHGSAAQSLGKAG